LHHPIVPSVEGSVLELAALAVGLVLFTGHGALRSATPNVTRAPACPATEVGTRTSHSLAYDAAVRRVVMFGGFSGNPSDSLPRSLWAWDGRRWECVAADGPPGRIDAFLAFDAARGRLVLFGGRVFEANRRMRFSRDTWEWDGAHWTLADTAGPGPRIHGPVAYDPVRRAVVIHGGGGAGEILHDTWQWTGSAWREIRLRAPADGIGDALLSDASGPTYLIAMPDSCPSGYRATLFRAAADSLGPIAPDGPCLSPISPASAAPGGFLLYLGWNKDEPAQSWTWDGTSWARSATAPPRRRGTAMAYDDARRRVVLFGGDGEQGLLGDTWEWDGRAWARVGIP
jgi:hypothetical protein